MGVRHPFNPNIEQTVDGVTKRSLTVKRRAERKVMPDQRRDGKRVTIAIRDEFTQRVDSLRVFVETDPRKVSGFRIERDQCFRQALKVTFSELLKRAEAEQSGRTKR